MQIVSTEDHLHGMSNPVDNLYEMQKSVIREKCKKKKKTKKNFKMLSAENFTQST